MPDRIGDDELLGAARAAARHAHVPYSNFRVGAAVEVEGRVVAGCNIENASYGLTVCAERVALFAAAATGARGFTRLAVSCVDADASLGPHGRMPCGACRQVMVELMAPDARVLVDEVGSFGLDELLPIAFRLT